ncbi:ABC transporter ATP-binding protein [Nigerium massiliense]|uniref:ABC transporter ATP-binding protein n=1 Tax=Nigerium massiliense TaxID=1522317 RepID=UPI00069437BB|nr:oligopeptide/dipeptide ABC transporter ATP-binding protein [Nigerium massiliense]
MSDQAEPAGRDALLSVDGLVVQFPTRSGGRRRTVHAVDGVDLVVHPRETVGVVGESGCGKSTLVRTILGLTQPTSGSITFAPAADDGHGGRRPRERDAQMVFQDPYSSINPRMSVGDIVAEPLRVQGIYDADGPAFVRELLSLVGMEPEHAERYPHEFSGGQRQRIGIARAIALRPRLLLLDEPVSALDVSIQAQVLNLLADLQQRFSMAQLFVSHDLSVVRFVCSRVYVMYLGRIVESGPTDQVLTRPRHPYTAALVSAVPASEPGHKRERIVLTGDVPSPVNPPSGCRFRTRCWRSTAECEQDPPMSGDVENGFACFHPLGTDQGPA